MKHLRSTYLLLYLAGMGSVLGSDLLVAAFHSESFISSWAEVRSLVGIVGIFCLIGLDQVFVRSPQSSARLLQILSIQIPLLAAPVALVVHGLGFLKSNLQAYFLGIASAGTIAVYQYYRSHHQRNMAQLAQQGWRIVIFVAIAILAIMPGTADIGMIVVSVMLTFLIFSLAFINFLDHRNYYQNPPEKVKVLYQIGARFMVTSVLLALAVYAEQLLVIKVGETEDSARYFTHATFFLFPIGVINSYAGFLLGPWVRDNHNQFLTVLKVHWKLMLMGIFAAAIVLNGIGYLGWWIMNPSVGAPSVILSSIFAFCGVMISIYQIPSAYNGVFAQPKHHDVLILGQIFALGIAFSSFYFIYKFMDVSVIISVAIASFINWMLRAGFGIFIVLLIANKDSLK